MISREIIQEILALGALAPSGSNSQPWKFKVTGETVLVRMLPEKDHPILNFRNRGTLLAHGALIENISIAAPHYGLSAAIELLPGAVLDADKNITAKIIFKEGAASAEDHPLFGALSRRATNRKKYEAKLVDESAKKAIANAPLEIGDDSVELKLTDDRAQIEALAAAASVNEVVTLEDKRLHQLFFQEIVWTEREEHERQSGLYLKTMELPPPARAALRIFRYWPVMRLFNLLGAAKGIAKGNAKGYAACPLYGAVLCGSEDIDFIKVGRVIERAWLRAATLGLSFHLQTGVNFLYQRVAAGGEGAFSEAHTRLIQEEYNKMVEVFCGSASRAARSLPAIFRIGYDGDPSARSTKKAPEILFK